MGAAPCWGGTPLPALPPPLPPNLGQLHIFCVPTPKVFDREIVNEMGALGLLGPTIQGEGGGWGVLKGFWGEREGGCKGNFRDGGGVSGWGSSAERENELGGEGGRRGSSGGLRGGSTVVLGTTGGAWERQGWSHGNEVWGCGPPGVGPGGSGAAQKGAVECSGVAVPRVRLCRDHLGGLRAGDAGAGARGQQLPLGAERAVVPRHAPHPGLWDPRPTRTLPARAG